MDVGDAKIEIPSNGPLTALLAVIPLQLIAYEIAVLKGLFKILSKTAYGWTTN